MFKLKSTNIQTVHVSRPKFPNTLWFTFRNIHVEWKMKQKPNKRREKKKKKKTPNIFTIIIKTIHCHTVIICYKLLLVSSSPGSLPGWWVIIVSPLRGSRYRVLNVPLWPVCSGYKCPLRCLLEPGLQSKGNSLCTIQLCMYGGLNLT